MDEWFFVGLDCFWGFGDWFEELLMNFWLQGIRKSFRLFCIEQCDGRRELRSSFWRRAESLAKLWHWFSIRRNILGKFQLEFSLQTKFTHSFEFINQARQKKLIPKPYVKTILKFFNLLELFVYPLDAGLIVSSHPCKIFHFAQKNLRWRIITIGLRLYWIITLSIFHYW